MHEETRGENDGTKIGDILRMTGTLLWLVRISGRFFVAESVGIRRC